MASYPATSHTITAISALLVVSAGLNLLAGSMTIVAQIYTSTNDTFVPLPGALVTFAPITGLLTTGTVFTASATGLNVTIPVGERVLLAFSATTDGLGLLATFTGYASAGVTQI
jgi:BclB C-terminal domain-containing protein